MHGRTQLDPEMPADSIEAPQNELPCVPRLSPFPILFNHLLNASENMWGWNWVNWCCLAETTQLQTLCFKKAPYFIGTCYRNYIFDYSIGFIAGPWARKLTPHLIYCVKTAATWMLLWQQENCMWREKSSRLHLSSNTLFWGNETRLQCTEQWNHVRLNKSTYPSQTSEPTSLPRITHGYNLDISGTWGNSELKHVQ